MTCSAHLEDIFRKCKYFFFQSHDIQLWKRNAVLRTSVEHTSKSVLRVQAWFLMVKVRIGKVWDLRRPQRVFKSVELQHKPLVIHTSCTLNSFYSKTSNKQRSQRETFIIELSTLMLPFRQKLPPAIKGDNPHIPITERMSQCSLK